MVTALSVPLSPPAESMTYSIQQPILQDRERARKNMLLTYDLFNATWHARLSMAEVAQLWLDVVSPEAAVTIRAFLEDAQTQARLAAYRCQSFCSFKPVFVFSGGMGCQKFVSRPVVSAWSYKIE